MFKKYLSSSLSEELRSVFCWHLVTTNTCLIPVRLLNRLNICPFSPMVHLNSMSILHHLCLNCESHLPIQSILDYFSNALDPLDYIEKLNTPSMKDMNTAAHYSLFGGKIRNFEVLMQHETDIWKPNFRGIRPYDVFSRLMKVGMDFKKIEAYSIVTVRDRLKNYFMSNILFICKM